jgi:hypothetical protein
MCTTDDYVYCIGVVELCFELGTAAAGKLMAASIEASQAAEPEVRIVEGQHTPDYGLCPCGVLVLTT